ncbi:MAG: hypothetical protein QOK31_936 [Solirubrobacteraceae bacterium]|nr:hypothetical protein [Solirubrobacteraceae bacterium]
MRCASPAARRDEHDDEQDRRPGRECSGPPARDVPPTPLGRTALRAPVGPSLVVLVGGRYHHTVESRFSTSSTGSV